MQHIIMRSINCKRDNYAGPQLQKPIVYYARVILFFFSIFPFKSEKRKKRMTASVLK